MTIHQHIDEARRRVTLTLTGDVRGHTFLREFTALVEGRPELVNFDYLFDMMDYVGDIGAADVAPVASTFVRLAGPQGLSGRSAFVTTDPYFDCWAAAFDHQFPGRLHRVFDRTSQAQAWLSGERLAAASPERTEPSARL